MPTEKSSILSTVDLGYMHKTFLLQFPLVIPDLHICVSCLCSTLLAADTLLYSYFNVLLHIIKYVLGPLTECGDLDLGGHLLVVGVDALAVVLAGVLLPQVLDEQHDGGVARLLLRVDSAKIFRERRQLVFHICFC